MHCLQRSPTANLFRRAREAQSRLWTKLEVAFDEDKGEQLLSGTWGRINFAQGSPSQSYTIQRCKEVDREEEELPESRPTFRKMEPPLMLLSVGTQYPITLSIKDTKHIYSCVLAQEDLLRILFLLVLPCLAIVLEEENLQNPFYQSGTPN